MTTKTIALWSSAVLLWIGCDGLRAIDVTASDTGPPDTSTRATEPDTCVYPEGGCRSVDDCPPGYTACVGCDTDPCFPELNGCYGQCVRAGQRDAGCRRNDDCEPEQFCLHRTGCADIGECTQRTPGVTVCDAFGPPVCGCDGEAYGCEEQAWSAGTSVASNGQCRPPSCEDVSCGVVESCCHCEAVDASSGPLSCNTPPCVMTVCQAWGLNQPGAQCVAGQCLLVDQDNACSSDADCRLHDDCCICAALPKTATRDPASCPTDCEVGLCQAKGLHPARARCVKGQCRVVLD